MFIKSLKNLFICLLLNCGVNLIFAQQSDSVKLSDSILISPTGKSISILDSTTKIDTILNDSIIKADTLGLSKKKNNSEIDAPVVYSSTDSMTFNIKDKTVYLYKEGDVKYQEINLKADYIEFGMSSNLVYASGLKDSTGKIHGKPIFTEKEQKFESEKIKYNFETKKGLISKVVTEQEGGFLHAQVIKRQPNEHIHLKNGKYTTCNDKHPHFYLFMTKAKVIPKDKIVAGPSYVVIEDIPLYCLGLPFGFFPNSEKSKSGILIPEYGEEEQRGFFLRDGGYYFAISDRMDLKVLGSIYTNGTWGSHITSNYLKRYKYNGYFDGNFYRELRETRDSNGLGKSGTNEIAVRWTHQQDTKANPYSRFNANVDFGTTTYDKNFSYNYALYTQSSKSSSISYNKMFPNSPFNLSANIRHDQNNLNRTFNVKLPELSLDMNRISPFQNKKNNTKPKWYENIQLSYSARVENNINTYDSIIFKDFNKATKNLNNGFKHSVPLSMNIKTPIKNFTVVPNISYDGTMYTKYIEKSWDNQLQYDSISKQYISGVRIDTINKLRYAHSVKPALSFNYSPQLFGMYRPLNPDAKIEAVRHVITPMASLSLTPDIRKYTPDYWDTVYKNNNNDTIMNVYSYFEQGIYGTPSLNGKTGIVNLGLKNNLEMKIKQPTDTSMEYKKFALLERFDINTSYNIFADSMNWSFITVDANNRFINNLIDLRATASFDPYSYKTDNFSNHFRTKEFYWDTKHKIVHMSDFRASIGTNFSNSLFSKKDNTTETEKQTEEEQKKKSIKDDGYSYFKAPWSLNVSYTFNVQSPYDTSIIVQTLNFSGQFSLTDKWRVTYNSGYDFSTKNISLTTFNIVRDLHCWEMSLDISPFGPYKYYFFKINVKSQMLGDLKYEKRKNWRDY